MIGERQHNETVERYTLERHAERSRNISTASLKSINVLYGNQLCVMPEDGNPVITRITNAEIVLEHFGYWPRFHDAEIAKVTFESHSGHWPLVTFVISAFEMTKEIDEKGYFKLIKQCDIESHFAGVEEIEFDRFSHQNVLVSLDFEESGSFIKTTFDAFVGLDAVIFSEGVSVVSLTPIKR